MEFYHIVVLIFCQINEFQFPTGWNSTHQVKNTRKYKKRFNSQRDGILHMLLLTATDMIDSFNSQRDGILHSHIIFRIFVGSVSIPNGMEFYGLYSGLQPKMRVLYKRKDGFYGLYSGLQQQKVAKFQFPTGWNSTISPENWSIILSGFNSQRDGILRLSDSLLPRNSYVSIPNGMEFYQGCRLYRRLFRCFNSQRDGILLFSFRSDLLKFPLFQFPTGWNSTPVEISPCKFSLGFNSQRDGILQTILKNLSFYL